MCSISSSFWNGFRMVYNYIQNRLYLVMIRMVFGVHETGVFFIQQSSSHLTFALKRLTFYIIEIVILFLLYYSHACRVQILLQIIVYKNIMKY